MKFSKSFTYKHDDLEYVGIDIFLIFLLEVFSCTSSSMLYFS